MYDFRSLARFVAYLLLPLAVVACTPPTNPDQVEEAPPADPFLAALDSINDLIVKNPKRAAHYEGRALLYMQVDSLTPAQHDLERIVKMDSTNVRYHLMLGDLYYKTIQVDKAFAEFETAARLDPANTSALLKQAEIQLVLRNYERAMNLVNTALRKDQHAAHGYFLKGWIHMETGDTALALSSFRTAVEQDSEDYSAYILLGKISAARHDPLAEQYYETAISLRPRSVEAWYNKGMYYQEHGQDSAALECYRQIREIDPGNALAWYNSGYVRMEHLDDLTGAKHDFGEAIRLEPGYIDAWYNRGLALERSNELDSAAVNYEMAMVLAPQHDLAAQGLSRLESRGVRVNVPGR